jgi:murein L,D-transpeptidase YcbB/YkuD
MRALGIAVFVVCASACGGKIDNSQYVEPIGTILEGTPSWVEKTATGRRLWAIEREFYKSRGHLPAWIDGVETTPLWKALVSELKYSEAHGLTPASYGVDTFEQAREASQTRFSGTRFDVSTVPELDARMTYAYLRYAADLLGWTRSARQVHRQWLTDSKKEDLAARLTEALGNDRIRESLEELAPAHPQYKGLQAALADQRTAPLPEDASAGQAPGGRAEVIRMNMERWRWAARDLGDRYILINVPAYVMQVNEGDRPVLSMRVIVGEPDHQTPLFSDQMTYIVFSPYWNIPPQILRDETLPRVARDPSFLERNNIEVVGTSGTPIDPSSIDWSDELAAEGVRFRQRPGEDNALGLVKFIFPNNFNVYLHDTPTDKLFFKEKRAFSHGCIRVEDPVALARYVLRDQPEWTDGRIQEAMAARRERAVKLTQPIPVHIGYWTAWVEPDGKTVTYTDDPYGIDEKHARLVGNPTSRRPNPSPQRARSS